MTTRPTQEHVRAILFPVDEKRPKLIWLHCEWVDREEHYDRKWQSRNATLFLNGDRGTDYSVGHNPILARHPANPVYVSCRQTFLVDGSAPNMSVEVITNTMPGLHHDWRGPFLAYGKVGPSLSGDQYRDVDMTDFRHIADYFTSYNSDRVSSVAITPPTALKIKGVKINCTGDQKIFNKPHFEEIELSPTDKIFIDHDTSDIAERIGLPIFTKRCFLHPNLMNKQNRELLKDDAPFLNHDAVLLHLCCDPKAELDPSKGTVGWGLPSVMWSQSAGSAIVVRQDKKPLLPWHMEALCKFCRYNVVDLLWHPQAIQEPAMRDRVLSFICQPAFSMFWGKMVEEKRENCVVVDAPSPYEV
ncbi:hypothetical protein O1611_g4375 [Lasiodiplodia mahajangana]|uniref:Uncharacterized protein n=1 Tax=Lasiodiplodia mahajangana TaxID=1108764 RepID=A0ACC2JP28_9PEZI|nr:hypothetical protein O1611_g4375 [Lasiodiplodia mahajangana]